MPTDRIYSPAERPDVEVEVGGVWLIGELRAWYWRDGAWQAQVQWRPVGTNTRQIDTFPLARVRQAEPPAPR